jgi:hypothetical protein
MNGSLGSTSTTCTTRKCRPSPAAWPILLVYSCRVAGLFFLVLLLLLHVPEGVEGFQHLQTTTTTTTRPVRRLVRLASRDVVSTLRPSSSSFATTENNSHQHGGSSKSRRRRRLCQEELSHTSTKGIQTMNDRIHPSSSPFCEKKSIISSSIRTLLLSVCMAATVLLSLAPPKAAHAAAPTIDDYSTILLSTTTTNADDDGKTNNNNNNNYYHWDLLNGSVNLTTEPIHLQFRDRITGKDRSVTLSARPQIVGAGAGGAVFAFDQHPSAEQSTTSTSTSTAFQQQDFLLKISWEGTAKTVQRECKTLQLLEDRNVQSAERCLGIFDYQQAQPQPQQTTKLPRKEEEAPRSMILVGPYMRDEVASIAQVDNDAARAVAVNQIVRTLVQMLAANVITIDVQPLISKTTGETIFIDMTEAQVLSSKQDAEEYSFLDQTLISSFTSEMVALIPEEYWKIAKTSILDEMELMKDRGTELSKPARLILQDQTPFLVEY